MKQTTPDAFLTRVVLTAIRDDRPTIEEFISRFGEHCFHILRKAGAILMDGERVRLNPQHLASNEQRFMWGQKIIHLDEDMIDFVRRGPQDHRKPE